MPDEKAEDGVNVSARDQLQQFRLDRSKNAASAANESSRLMAQATLLMNGGAATAVIAVLSKDKVDPAFLRAIPESLWGYAAGLFFAFAGMFVMTECLDQFNKVWEEEASRTLFSVTEKWANRLWHGYRVLFGISAICFIVSSLWLAHALSDTIAHPALAMCAPD
jgi:hypothetical protein